MPSQLVLGAIREFSCASWAPSLWRFEERKRNSCGDCNMLLLSTPLPVHLFQRRRHLYLTRPAVLPFVILTIWPDARRSICFCWMKGWAEIKRTVPRGRRNNDLTANSSNSVDRIALNGLEPNHGGLKVSRHLPPSPASSAFSVCSLRRSASCFLFLWSSNLICKSSAACWSSRSWDCRETK